MKKVALIFHVLPLSLLCFERKALAQTLLLDDFEYDQKPIVQPTEAPIERCINRITW